MSQSLLRELAEVERLITEGEETPLGKPFRENEDGANRRSSARSRPGQTLLPVALQQGRFARHRESVSIALVLFVLLLGVALAQSGN
jgi:hypothetical protein